jgi:hypothetical protein
MIGLALVGSAPGSHAAESEALTAKLDRASVQAHGDQSALLTVSAFGRYAVTANSAQGVALQLVDRMAGAGTPNGDPGKQDGRLDLFLDRGEYKILTHASNAGKGVAKLAAHPFHELQAHPPLLIEHRLERASLGDFEQRSYWIEIKEKRVVALEAAGRHLADLRLWRDGTWLVNATPQFVQSQARAGQPLQIARLSTELAPGLYLLTAYGGPSQVWTQASDAKPFYLRMGIPTLAPAMRQQFTMSEFGTDRYLVPAGPNYFRLELPAAQPATLQVGEYVARNPLQAQGQSVSIDKRSLLPVAEASDVGGSNMKVVTVSMDAGKPFILQHFDASTTVNFEASGDYWVGSIHAGAMEDSVGASAVLTRERRNAREEYLDAQVLELAKNTSWHRRFNLLGELTLFVKVSEPTKVRVAGTGVAARYRFEPFLLSRPYDYKAPPWRVSGSEFELDRGLHVLTIAPDNKGILDLHLSGPGGKPGDAMSALNPAVRFAPLTLESNARYTLYLNRQPGVVSGAVLRPLPVDLQFALPVAQRAGETLTIPVRVAEPGRLQAVAEDGRMLELALDNGKAGTGIDVTEGRYRVTIRGADKARGFSLQVEPTRLASTTPLPAVPDARLAALPKFPVITPDAPRFVDLGRRGTTVHQVRVDKPGLYQFESTGLLETSGTVRTRTNPSLFADTANGVGRNFMIQRYLREGDYQLSVATQGETLGHLGIQIARTEVEDGGDLREGQAARAMLPTAHAIAYRFRIAKRGTYHLQTLGLGRNFDIRLEDDAGWPVGAPVRQGDLTEELAPGSYRLLVMPQTAEARVLTRLDRVPEPATFKGHGPHCIALETPVEHTWVEPAKGAARTPDQWEFALPAAADVAVILDNEMEATLANASDPKHAPLAKFDAKHPWRGKLAAGRYLVETVNGRTNNYVHYTVRISATQLLAGQTRTVTAPASIPVSVGSDGLVEIESFGASDVRARLLDNAGELVAQNDDRPDDWNFHLAQRLRPGEYSLRVDPVNEKHARTTVSVMAPAEVVEKPLALGADVEIADEHVHIYLLSIPADRNVLLVSAQSSDAVGLALEGQSAGGWVNLGGVMKKAPYLVLPLPSGKERFQAYRLRGWSADRRSLHVRLHAVAATLPMTSESQWMQGASAQRVDPMRPALHVAMISLARAGTFRIKGDLSRLQWSDSGARVSQGGTNPVVSISGKTLWVVSEDTKQGEPGVLAAQRVRLPTGEQESLRLELMAGQTGAVDLQPQAAGPSLVIAQSRVGQPGVALGDVRDPRAMGLVPGEVAAIALAGTHSAATVWNAASPGMPMELDVRQVPLQQAAAQTFGIGVSEGSLKPRMALPVKLPGNLLRFRLTLDPMTAAVFLKHGAIVSTHWGGAEALLDAVQTDADQLLLLNADAHTAHYGLEITPPAGEAEQALNPGGMLERNVGTAGRLRIPVEIPKASAKGAPEAYTLRIRGNGTALWIERGGRIDSGNDIAIRDSGMLLVQHQPGALVAWLDAPRTQDGHGTNGWFKSLQETTVKPPQTVALHGKQQVLTLKFESAAMLHVRTSVPVVTQFVVDGQQPQTAVYLNGANANLLAPAGTSRLLLRAVGADSLSGAATVLATPIVRLSEGPGPESLLPPGDARLYSFELKERQTIGIGVRASSDVVRSVVYDEHGATISEGVVQMPTLSPGRYYLAIEMPVASAPVRVQPIMLGINKPDTRPPMDILRRYVESKDGEALLYVPPPPAPPPSEQSQNDQPQDEGNAAAEGEGSENGGEGNDNAEQMESAQPESDNNEEAK